MHTARISGRLRLAPIVEWIVAAGFLFATIAVASLVVRELQGPARIGASPASTPAARPLIASTPAAIPPRAVSVPVLPFLDGKEIRIGATAAAVAASLCRAAESGRQEVDRGTLGERLTRFYEYAGSRFILVFEPFERNGEARVAAIYLP
jgi:hypothetical protein